MKTKFFIAIALSVATTNIVPLNAIGQKFIHPGIDQTAADLAQMKKIGDERRATMEGCI